MKTFFSFIDRSTGGPQLRTSGLRGVVVGISCSAVLFSILSGRLIAQDTPPETAAPAVGTETFTPREYPIDRYQKLRGKSPFEFELAKPIVQDAADPFADLVLAGYAGSASRPTVYVVNTKTQERITILPEGNSKKDATGFRILSVNRGRNLATTTVKVEKNGVQKELAFDPKALSSMTAGATGGQPGTAPLVRLGQNVQPGQPGYVPPGARPVMPGLQTAPARFVAPQAFIPNQNNRANGQVGGNGIGQSMTGGAGGGGQGTAAFIPGQAATAAGNSQGIVMQNQGSQNQPVTPDNTVRSVEQQAQINAILDGKVPTSQQPQPRRRVVLPTTSP